jgi:putative membrane protein
MDAMPYEVWNRGPGPGWWVGGSIMMILFWGALIVLVVYAMRHFGHTHPAAPTDSAPLEELKMRFARGEIDEDEFTRRTELLKNTK